MCAQEAYSQRDKADVATVHMMSVSLISPLFFSPHPFVACFFEYSIMHDCSKGCSCSLLAVLPIFPFLFSPPFSPLASLSPLLSDVVCTVRASSSFRLFWVHCHKRALYFKSTFFSFFLQGLKTVGKCPVLIFFLGGIFFELNPTLW